jgi:hypothetical protein
MKEAVDYRLNFMTVRHMTRLTCGRIDEKEKFQQ